MYRKTKNQKMQPIKKVKSCGFFLMRDPLLPSFLLMKHANRFDLPKGHVEKGEKEIECALRELSEETGITANDILIEPKFCYRAVYYPTYKRFDGKIKKTLVMFLGWMNSDVEIKLTEHVGYEWIKWNPPHKIQKKTIDPLIKSIEEFLIEQKNIETLIK